MDLNPTRSTGDCLSPIISSPALDEADSNRTHPSELVDCLESFMDGLSKALGEILIVEHLEVVAWGNLADCCWMPASNEVSVW